APLHAGREIGLERQFPIDDLRSSRRFDGGLERARDDERDGLALIQHEVALERQQILPERKARDLMEARRVHVRENLDHARRSEFLCGDTSTPPGAASAASTSISSMRACTRVEQTMAA